MRFASYIALVCLACTACSGPAPSAALPQGRKHLAELPLAQASAHRRLQEELALLKVASGLPWQLDIDRSRTSIARPIADVFPPISRPMMRARLDDIYPGGPLALSPIDLEQGRQLLRQHDAACEKFRQTIGCPDVAFNVPPAEGMLADLSFLESLEIGCRLEAIAAAVALAENRPIGVQPHLAAVLRAASLLAAERNVSTRLAAAKVRAQGLEILAAASRHPQASRATHEKLLEVLTDETADWPGDAEVWIGERAAGLVVYELVRDGQYLSLLSPQQVKRLEEEHSLEITAQAVMRGIDEDEAFYLWSMRQLIEASHRPYGERLSAIEAIRTELAARESGADYPLVAGRLLLADFETVQRVQGEVSARCQAWLLALQVALGRGQPAKHLSALTGQPYRVEQGPLAVRVCELPAGRAVCEVPIVR
jgi:hypothetical protein